MLVWHRMRGGVRTMLAVVACSATVVAGTSSTARGQQRPGGTEWYRQPAHDPNVIPAGQQLAQADPATPPSAAAPAQPDVAKPEVAQPNAGPAPAPQGAFAQPAINPALRPYRMPPVGGPYGGYGSVSGLYPSSEMNNYVVASARSATARALFRQAESELGQAYRVAQRQFDTSEDYKQSLRDERDAYNTLNAARTKAFASLDGDQKYQRLLGLRQDLAERLQEGRARRVLSPDEVMAMATLKMSYATEMRAIEAGALGNEPSVRDAQERLVTLGQRVSGLRQVFDQSLRDSPEILLARRNLEDARVARLTADAYLRATMVAGSYAMDYAYYLYRTPGSGGGGFNQAGWGGGYNRY